MPAVQLRSVILSLLLFPLAALPLTAKPVELKDLTQELLRGRVKEYLNHPDSAQRRAALSGVVLRDDQVFYIAQGGVPRRLEWRYQVLPSYDRTKEAQTQAALRDLLHDVLVRFEGGLLSEANAQQLLAQTVFVSVPAPPGLMPPTLAIPPAQPGAVAYGYNPWRYIVYPWVATAPRCFNWWQYPWYAAPWWAPPWTSYWYVPGYYPTPWGYWWLAPEFNYWAYWQTPGYYPAYVPYHNNFAPFQAPAPITAERTAESLYVAGFDRYWDGDSAEAKRLLSAAVERDPNDARIWYFKALAERQLGEETAANESARRGAALELLSTARMPISGSLERVQGDARWFLRAAGADLTAAKAREIVAAPVKVAAK